MTEVCEAWPGEFIKFDSILKSEKSRRALCSYGVAKSIKSFTTLISHEFDHEVQG